MTVKYTSGKLFQLGQFLALPVLIFILIFDSNSAMAASEEDKFVEWELVKENEFVKVYLEKNSKDIRSVRAETTIESPLYAVPALFGDSAVATEWIDRSVSVDVLEREEVGSFIVRTVFDMPWPFKDREMITRNTICSTDNAVTISVKHAADRNGTGGGIIRILDVRGIWSATQLPDNKVHIEYRGAADPAGLIPYWLARLSVKNATFKTFNNLRKQLLKTKYQTKPLAYEEIDKNKVCSTSES